MKVAILCQEEPVFLGPFLQEVIRMHSERIVAVFIAGRRGAGERRQSLHQRLTSLRIFWHVMEPRAFLGGLALRLRARLFGRRDPRSVEGLARRLTIPVHRIIDPNTLEFQQLLSDIAPDVVLNQSEIILKSGLLSIPKMGFVNRHASLLPDFRGRMGCFWSHAAEDPRYGVTIHLVDEGVDTGPIIHQQEFHDVQPAWSYPKVMQHLCAAAPGLFWNAMERLEQGTLERARPVPAGKPCGFPALDDARRYSRMLRQRRDTANVHTV